MLDLDPKIRAKQLSHQGSLMQRHLNEIDHLEKLDAKDFDGMDYHIRIAHGSITKEQRERLIFAIADALDKFKKNEIADVEERIQCLLETWIDKESQC